jgi:hypothetical protein
VSITSFGSRVKRSGFFIKNIFTKKKDLKIIIFQKFENFYGFYFQWHKLSDVTHYLRVWVADLERHSFWSIEAWEGKLLTPPNSSRNLFQISFAAHEQRRLELAHGK